MTVEMWKRCLMPHYAFRPTEICDKPVTEWPDQSWRCPDGHYNAPSSLMAEALGRLVREVWVVWATDRKNLGEPFKPHHLLPWEQLDAKDREVDRRIGETLAGIRDWRIGQTVPPQDAGAKGGERATPSPTCEWCERCEWDDDDGGHIGVGPKCGKPAMWLSCMPLVKTPTCDEHKCRCAKPLAPPQDAGAKKG